MEILTSRFGPVEVDSGDVLHFPEGLLGLADCRDWVLLADEKNDSLAWMQSVERADVALAVVAPRRFVPGYRIRVARREFEPLKFEDVHSAQVLLIVSRTDQSITVNLKAPIVLNLDHRLGRQVVTNGDLPLQYALVGAPQTLKKSA